MLISILGKIAGVFALVLGIRTGYRWWSNAEDRTVRIGTRADNLNNSFVDLVICCVLGYFAWGIPLILPLVIIEKIGWIPVLIVVGIIAVIVLGKE